MSSSSLSPLSSSSFLCNCDKFCNSVQTPVPHNNEFKNPVCCMLVGSKCSDYITYNLFFQFLASVVIYFTLDNKGNFCLRLHCNWFHSSSSYRNVEWIFFFLLPLNITYAKPSEYITLIYYPRNPKINTCNETFKCAKKMWNKTFVLQSSEVPHCLMVLRGAGWGS